MNIWFSLTLILAVVAVYMLTIEIYSVAFKLTGLSTSKIKFQDASLFTSTGFTASESELITNDKKRKRIALACTYTGHVFSVIIMGLVINFSFSISMTVSEGHQTPSFTDIFLI